MYLSLVKYIHKIFVVLFIVLMLLISQTYVLIVSKVYPFSSYFFSFLKFNMVSKSRTLEFTAAVRGFHAFRKKWKPGLNEQLHCL